MTAMYGEEGKRWLADLPNVTESIASRLRLTGLKPLDQLTYHYVLSGMRGDQSVILKLGLDRKGLRQEAAALRVFHSHGAVAVLAEEEGALLLEHARPGSSLKDFFPLRDLQSVQIACGVMQRLHRAPLPKAGTFPSIKEQLLALDREVAIPKLLLDKARQVRDQLLLTAKPSVLLHGDLHHGNILAHGEGWVAIDPQGVMGEPVCEVAAFVRNPMPVLLDAPDVLFLMTERLALLSKLLCVDQGRLVAWCFVQAVLAWVWAIEDGQDTGYFKDLAALFATLTKKPPPRRGRLYNIAGEKN